ncbi:DUF5063 domain-containing protein [Dysgonomonas massiliensis]|uniref:DUF5063 domain-containing protein n=1 Tax=Dysgonomonas massiliensis TaxID=2040292 RepID=UPI000C790A89|nr:DUF5063 domain-containing protein [Dysgonomonas massiliensis]
MNESLKKIVFSKDTVEFTTVAVQYCLLLETLEDTSKEDLTDKLTKMLPLLYLKATMIPETEMVEEDEQPEVTVTEEDYNYMLAKLSNIFKEDDTYLEVFLEDMKYSETPIAASIAEDLTDIYQDLKNYITIFERGIVENMNDALFICNENYKSYWGQKLVNVLRALHSVKYSSSEDDYTSDDVENDFDL